MMGLTMPLSAGEDKGVVAERTIYEGRAGWPA
jgi:hypothetical protein